MTNKQFKMLIAIILFVLVGTSLGILYKNINLNQEVVNASSSIIQVWN